MKPSLLPVACSAGILAASLDGVLVRMNVRVTHARIQLAMSFVAGPVLEVALYCMMPQCLARISGPRAVAAAVWWMIPGSVTMVLLLRVFQFHRHEVAGGADQGHRRGSRCPNHSSGAHPLKWLAISLATGLHSLTEGAVPGASTRRAAAAMASDPVSFKMLLAVLLHKSLNTFSILGLMRIAGVNHRTVAAINDCSTLPFPLASFLDSRKAGLPGPAAADVTGRALAFGAGVLVWVSPSDPLPEIQLHGHDGSLLSLAFVSGIAVAFALYGVEQPQEVGLLACEGPHRAGHADPSARWP